MLGLNRVFLMGNLTRDPELRYTPNGTAVASFGVAVNRKYTTKDGDRKEDVDFFDIEVWSKQAENCNECRECEEMCPQQIEISYEMKNVHQRLGAC